MAQSLSAVTVSQPAQPAVAVSQPEVTISQPAHVAVSQPEVTVSRPAMTVSQPAQPASLSPIFLSDSSESEVSDSEFNGLGAELLSQLSDSGQLLCHCSE